MDNSYELFDKHIREKLEGLEVTTAPEGWEALVQKIDADTDLNPVAIATDPFDDMIKSKLEAGNTAYDPVFWSLMENKIEADADLSTSVQIEDVELDGMIYENLNSYQVPYNPNHWELMVQHLRKEFSLQSKLYRYKVAEVSLMILAILTLLQFYPGQGNQLDYNYNKAENKAPQAFESQEQLEEDPDSENLVSTKSIEEATFTFTKENEIEANHLAINNSPTSVKKDKENLDLNSNSNNIKSNPVAGNANKNGALSKPYLLPELIIENQVGASISNKQFAILEKEKVNQNAIPSFVAPLEQADLAEGGLMDLLLLESTTMSPLGSSSDEPELPICILCTQKPAFFFKVGMMTSLDLNRVMTPYDDFFTTSAYDQLTSGYTGGINLGVYRGRFGLSTGLSYSSKNYEPTNNQIVKGSVLDGFVSEGLKAVQLNMISIPLNVNYTIDATGKWQWYTLAGASVKLAAVNNFDVKTTTVGARNLEPVDPRNSTVAETDEETEGPYDGILEGGSFKDNLFLTANLGFGMERYVTPRWSLFAQPIYQHSLYKKGLGPNRDRIHTMSLFFGTRVRLK